MSEPLERFISDAYEQGSVKDRDGNAMALEPHSVSREQGEGLRALADAEGAERTIEVGLALGMSALFLCQVAQSHVAIDPFQSQSWSGAGVRTLADAGVAERVELIEEESALALPELVRAGREFDLAFIDGDHRFEGVLLDLVFMDRLVKPGGVIVVDDMWMPAVRLAVSYVEKNLELALEPDAVPGGFRWRRGSRLRPRLPEGNGDTAVLRRPLEAPHRPWDGFADFYNRGRGGVV